MGKSSYLLKDQRNFNEILRKDATYDNFKSHPCMNSCVLLGRLPGRLIKSSETLYNAH